MKQATNPNRCSCPEGARCAIAEAGHAIGHHGHLHKFIDPDNPNEEMEKGLAALEQVVGVKPAGYRLPAADSNEITIKLVQQ